MLELDEARAPAAEVKRRRSLPDTGSGGGRGSLVSRIQRDEGQERLPRQRREEAGHPGRQTCGLGDLTGPVTTICCSRSLGTQQVAGRLEAEKARPRPQPRQGGARAESRREGPAKASRQKRGVNRTRGGVSSLFTASPPTPASAQGHGRAAGPGIQHCGRSGAQSEGT